MSKQRDAGLREPPVRGQSAVTRELPRVEEANFSFYEAFANRDIEQMARLWSQSPYTRCVHPGWEPVVGWPDIRQSWIDIFGSITDISFDLNDIHVEVVGPVAWVNLIAYCTIDSEEEGEFETAVVATTIFEETDGEWLVSLHHSSNYIDEDELDEDEIEMSLRSRGGSSSGEPN